MVHVKHTCFLISFWFVNPIKERRSVQWPPVFNEYETDEFIVKLPGLG